GAATVVIRVFVPSDTAARSVGADAVATAIVAQARARNIDIELLRNGTRALYWLEPLVEVATQSGRVAYGPVAVEDVESLFAAGFHAGSPGHPLHLGDPEDIPYLRDQRRLTFARIGRIDPLALEDYRGEGGFRGLEQALAMAPADIVRWVRESGLRGRGGAAFPTGIKWRTVLDAPGERKYVVCNADEGDSGTFADRLVMECDPYLLIEGMVIAGLAVGATEGYIYLRSEYPLAWQVLNEAIRRAGQAGYLGASICDSGRSFELEVRLGAGAYICGEETALLDSLEGKRGMVRAKPPLPALRGLFGQPTVVNNVLSLAAVPTILDRGPEAYAALGRERSRGTLVLQLAGNVRRGGWWSCPSARPCVRCWSASAAAPPAGGP
ncbi:MAG: formate dehydrogenase, partial [Parahaliea sp.]